MFTLSKERVNNASWCCDQIENLIESYKNEFRKLSSIGERSCRDKAEIYLSVIRDLEKIIYTSEEFY